MSKSVSRNDAIVHPPKTHLYHFFENHLKAVRVRSQRCLVALKFMHGGGKLWVIELSASHIRRVKGMVTVDSLRTGLERGFLLGKERVVVLPILGLNEERPYESISKRCQLLNI